MKEDSVVFQGVVTQVLPSAKFKIKLENDHEIIGHLSGKMRTNNITILLGDKVTVELSLYDLSKGRITYRHK